MADIDQKAYDEAMAAAEMSVDRIQIQGVTSDNWADKVAEQNLIPVTDENGNVSGYYTDTLMSVVEPGKFTTSKKVQVYMVPTVDPSSTSSNLIINFDVMPAGATNTKPGGQTVYTTRNDALVNTMRAAGYEISPDIPPEIINQLWEEYNEDEDTKGNIVHNANYLVASNSGIPGKVEETELFDTDLYDIAVWRMKLADFTGVEHPWLGAEDDALARLLKAAAKVGLTDVGEIFEDDEATKAMMRQATVGQYIQLTAVGDRDGSVFDEDWLEAFIKPMLMIETAYLPSTIPLPSDEQWEDEYYIQSGGQNVPIAEYIDNQVYNAVNKHVNIWLASYNPLTFNGSYYWSYIILGGTYIDPNLNWEVLENYPDRGYARIEPRGTFYAYQYHGRAYGNDHFNSEFGNYPSSKILMIYDQESFIEYLEQIGAGSAQTLLTSTYIVFSNGSVAQKNPYSTKTRPDALKITANSTTADIIVQMEQDPVWPDNKITIPEYDPVTNTTINHNYYPVTPGVQDPRQVNWPDIKIPEIVSPINEIVKYPTIPSAISTPIQNDPMSPTAGSNRFWTIYNPSDAQMASLGAELWQQNAIQILKQTFVNPTDGIISWSQIFLNPTQDYQDFIYLGDYKTGVNNVPVITNPKIFKDFGIIKIPRFFEDYRDYTETQVSAYLPFIGFVDLDPRDVIGCDLHLEYWQDVITGTCVATISPKVGNNAECAYQFTGNAAVQLPITAADRSRLLSGILGGATQGAAAGGSIGGPVGAIVGGALGGAIGAASGAFGVQKSNGFSANAGALTKYKRPYILIHRSIPADPMLYDAYYGNPSNTTATLRNLHGFTRVRECYIDIPKATDAEKAMIEAQLKQGVILP